MSNYYKQAGVATEVAGTLFNPLNTMAGSAGLIGGAVGAKVTKTRTDKEQEEADKHSFRNLLVPGVAPYNLFKRYGHTKAHEMKERREKDKEDREHKLHKEKKASNISVQQAYIEGFVKRASEYGLNQNEAIELLKQATSKEDLKANVGLQTLFAGGAPGLLYNGVRDAYSPEGSPSRLLNISGRGLAGGLLGLLAGYGAGSLYENSNLPSISALQDLGPGATKHLGGWLGGMTGTLIGNNIGARKYNEKIDKMYERGGFPE